MPNRITFIKGRWAEELGNSEKSTARGPAHGVCVCLCVRANPAPLSPRIKVCSGASSFLETSTRGL